MSGEPHQRYDWNGTEWVPVEAVPPRPSAPAPMAQPVYLVNETDHGGRAVSLLLLWMLAFMWLITTPCWFVLLAWISGVGAEDESAAAFAMIFTLLGTATIALTPAGIALTATVRRR